MLKAEEPEWKEEAFTTQGKWMDGWESRCVLQTLQKAASSSWSAHMFRSSAPPPLCQPIRFENVAFFAQLDGAPS